MINGRKLDPTTQPSRALISQRDYRARKAQYLTELEQKCKILEEENERLSKEAEFLRAELRSRDPSSLPSNITAGVGLVERAHALTGVLSHLSAAITSIQEFQNATLGPYLSSESNHHYNPLRTTSFNSGTNPSSSSMQSQSLLPPLQAMLITSRSQGQRPSTSNHVHTDDEDWDPNSPYCCGGIFDCRGLSDDSAQAGVSRGGGSGSGGGNDSTVKFEEDGEDERSGEMTPTLENPGGSLHMHGHGFRPGGQSLALPLLQQNSKQTSVPSPGDDYIEWGRDSGTGTGRQSNIRSIRLE